MLVGLGTDVRGRHVPEALVQALEVMTPPPVVADRADLVERAEGIGVQDLRPVHLVEAYLSLMHRRCCGLLLAGIGCV